MGIPLYVLEGIIQSENRIYPLFQLYEEYDNIFLLQALYFVKTDRYIHILQMEF